jgi:hypothetical protein
METDVYIDGFSKGCKLVELQKSSTVVVILGGKGYAAS